MLPILYSFRRCPYAIRARMALHYAGISHELREVMLKDKPVAMLQASAKGTVPVLCLPDGCIIDESQDVMLWAVRQNDPEHWLPAAALSESLEWISANDAEFKTHLDHYKYWERYPEQSQEHYRSQAEVFLQRLEQRLSQHSWLLGPGMTLADVAIFPFIRQFAWVDKAWFDRAAYPAVQQWLQDFLQSSLFLDIMPKHSAWREGDSPVLISPPTAAARLT